VDFKKKKKKKKKCYGMCMCDDEQARMLEGSEFQTKVASTLKPRETKVVRTRGTDIRFFDLWRSVENVQECGN